MYPYGYSQGDQTVSCAWWESYCVTPRIRTGRIWIDRQVYTRFQINTNGLVSLGVPYDRRTPPASWHTIWSGGLQWAADRDGLAILAPLWTDSDISSWRNPDSRVFYQQYDRTQMIGSSDPARVQAILQRASEDAVLYGGYSQFDASFVIVVTWFRMNPRVGYHMIWDQPNTFQLIIIASGRDRQTLALFSYHDMGWNTIWYVRDSMIGYMSRHNRILETYVNPFSDTRNAFRMDMLNGNFGLPSTGTVVGCWLYALAAENSVDYDQLCFDWWAGEISRYGPRSLFIYNWIFNNVFLSACPCDLLQAFRDPRWLLYFFDPGQNRICFSELNWLSISKSCCYDLRSWTLIRTTNGRGGNLLLFNPMWVPNEHQAQDVDPKEWCCDLSDNCDLFYTVRPIDNCRFYVPPFWAWTFGDPHFQTLDGLPYTFNGLGEYVMLQTTGGNFTLQARTAPAQDSNGNDIEATVFSAFAAKDANSDIFQAEMNEARSELRVLVAGEDITNWFQLADVNSTRNFILLSLKKVDVHTVGAAFASGFSIQIRLQLGVLDLLVGAPEDFKDQTMGLLGVFNANPEDDLTRPNGTLLPAGASDEEIFYQFGELWKISNINESLFTYSGGNNFYTYVDVDFTPMFFSNLSVTPEVSASCNGSRECIYDTVTTGNAQIGQLSMSLQKDNNEDNVLIRNARPALVGDVIFNVTAQRVNEYTFSVSDEDGDPITVWMEPEDVPGATFDNLTLTLTWEPQSMDSVEFTFHAVDHPHGGVAPALVPQIRFCNCTNGECDFDDLETMPNSTSMFRVVLCHCFTGWTGDRCEEDYDGCQGDPCLNGTQCIDFTPDEQTTLNRAFNCSECPEGYVRSTDNDCIDVDECEHSMCNHNCSNQPGSFRCQCWSDQYNLYNDTHCVDVDECEEGQSTCQQLCVNDEPGYHCGCLPGYELEANRRSCSYTGGLQTPCEAAGLNCTHGCNVSADSCFCPVGYSLAADTQTCLDIDECTLQTDTCGDHTECRNTDPGFECPCEVGYWKDDNDNFCQMCPRGTWGEDCHSLCSCKDAETDCDLQTGCAECAVGFGSPDCSEDVDECLDQASCGPNSSCNNTIGSFRCECHEGYTPASKTRCQLIDYCASFPCRNGANCTNEFMGYSCDCVLGYTADNCSINIDECASSPCQNFAECVDRVNGYYCGCVGNWMGKVCEIAILLPEDEPTSAAPRCIPTFVTSDVIHRYTISMTLPDTAFLEEYEDEGSVGYYVLQDQVRTQMEEIFGCHTDFDDILVRISTFDFTLAKTVQSAAEGQGQSRKRRAEDDPTQTTFILELAAQRSEALIADTLRNASTDPGLAVPIDLDSIVVTILDDAVFPMWAIAVLFAFMVAMIAIAIPCAFWIRSKMASQRYEAAGGTDTDSSSGTFSGTFYGNSMAGRGRRMWHSSEGSTRLERTDKTAYDHTPGLARMLNINRAVERAPPIDWDVIRGFARRAVQPSMLHRGPPPTLPYAPTQPWESTMEGSDAEDEPSTTGWSWKENK